MTAPTVIGVGDAARRLTEEAGDGWRIRPADISALFYSGKLRDDLCPLLSGRRCIPLDYLWQIKSELRRVGKYPPIRPEVPANE